MALRKINMTTTPPYVSTPVPRASFDALDPQKVYYTYDIAFMNGGTEVLVPDMYR